MTQVVATGPAVTPGPLWKAPELSIERSKKWDQVSVAVFRRGGGDSVWRNPWHRLVLSLAPIGPIALSFDGGPTHRFAPHPGTLGFYPAGVEVSVSHGPGLVIQVLQDPLLYRGLIPECGGSGEARPIVNFVDPLVTQIARSLAAETGSGPADRLLVDGYGLSMALSVRMARRFAAVPRTPEAEARGLSRERLRRVLDHIEAHLGDDLSLAELASVACLSPFHFSRCFKRSLGVGLRRYVARRRVERAHDMIRRTNQPLAAIAQALGFADQSHFTHAFRLETGATPASFRAAAA